MNLRQLCLTRLSNQRLFKVTFIALSFNHWGSISAQNDIIIEKT